MVDEELCACDSPLLIDYLNGVREAQFVVRRLVNPVISRVTWIEVLAGLKPGQEVHAEELLESFEVLELTPEIAEATVLIRQSTRLKLPDAIILATARVTGRVLVTRNTRDFAGVANVRVPYTLVTH